MGEKGAKASPTSILVAGHFHKTMPSMSGAKAVLPCVKAESVFANPAIALGRKRAKIKISTIEFSKKMFLHAQVRTMVPLE